MNRGYISLSLYIYIAICLALTLFLGWIIRTPHLSALQGTSILDPDSARYLRQAKIILDQGHLPEIDRLRLYPIGKDSATQLSVYPYTLVFLHKFVSLLFRGITLEKIAMFSSVLFFSLSLIVFYFLIHRLLGWPTALLATNLCVVVPSTLSRSVVGIADRDAFCLFLALSSYYLYIRAHQSGQLRNRLIWGLLSGFLMMFLGLAWQGVGLFISIIVLLNFIFFLLPTYRRADLYLYLTWLAPVVIGLLGFGFKSVYRDRSQAYAIPAVGLPLGFLVLVLLSLILPKFPKFSNLCLLKGKVPSGFAVTAMTVGLGGFMLPMFSQDASALIAQAWTHFLAPFGSGRLAASIEELQKRGAMGWSVWPGYFLIFIIAGAMLLMKRVASSARVSVLGSLILFELLLAGAIFTHFVSIEDLSYEPSLMTSLYASSLFVFTIGMTVVYLWGYHKRRGSPLESRPDIGDLFLLVSFCVLLFSARGAMRFEFFFSTVAMAMGCYAFVYAIRALGISNRVFGGILLFLLAFEFYAVGKHLPGLRLPQSYYDSSMVFSFILLITIGISVVATRRAFGGFNRSRIPRLLALTALVFLLVTLGGIAPFTWLGGYADLSYAETAEIRPIITSSMSRALEWLKRNTPQSSVIAAWWDYGSIINLFSHRATIIDEEQLEYWGYLMLREVFFAETDQQALGFLKAHGATHLLITGRDLRSFQAMSILASDKDLDRYGFLMRCLTAREIIQSQSGGTIFNYASDTRSNFINESLTVNGKTYPAGSWKVDGIYLKLDGPNGDAAELLSVLVEIETEKGSIRLKPKEFYYKGIMYRQSGDVLPCSLLISSHTDNPLDWEILYLSPKVRNTLMVRLYLLNQTSDFFYPVYPPGTRFQGSGSDASDFSVRIWKIQYPDGLPTDSKYLTTDFPDPLLRKLWLESEPTEKVRR